jgi:hypothetical protein
MPVEIDCPSCHVRLQLDGLPKRASCTITCPTCRAELKIQTGPAPARTPQRRPRAPDYGPAPVERPRPSMPEWVIPVAILVLAVAFYLVFGIFSFEFGKAGLRSRNEASRHETPLTAPAPPVPPSDLDPPRRQPGPDDFDP